MRSSLELGWNMKKITRKFEVIPLAELPKNIVPIGSSELPGAKAKRAVRGRCHDGAAELARAVAKKAGR
jgi:hypothetical protein